MNLNLLLTIMMLLASGVMFFMQPVTTFYIMLGVVYLIWAIMYGAFYANDKGWIDLG